MFKIREAEVNDRTARQELKALAKKYGIAEFCEEPDLINIREVEEIGYGDDLSFFKF